VKKYICITACFWDQQLFSVGESVERPESAKMPAHFRVVSEQPAAVSTTEGTEAQRVAGEAGADLPPTQLAGTVGTDAGLPPDGSNNSALRENLKVLCGRNGITVKSNTTVDWMLAELKKKNITVM